MLDFPVISPYSNDRFKAFLGFRWMTSAILVQSTDQHVHETIRIMILSCIYVTRHEKTVLMCAQNLTTFLGF